MLFQMQRFDEIAIKLLFHMAFFIKDSSCFTSKIPMWSWECANEKCVPSQISQTREKLQSLETCNAFCSGSLLWPLPTGLVSLATSAVPVRADFFQMEVDQAPSSTVHQYLHDTFQLFKQDLRNMEGDIGNFGQQYNVVVRLSVKESQFPDVRLDTDESYKLSLEPVSSLTLLAEIVAVSFCGARHALETLSQLIWLDHYMGSLLIIQQAVINDAPKFAYRGLMIDTARNHIPFSELLHTVDAMAASKLNTLHWHASDSQGFSLHFNSVPELSRYGTNRPSDIYSSDQIKALVHRARLRGIRVLIEIDTPAHITPSWNWAFGNYGNVVVQCSDDESSNSRCENPPCCLLNPLNPFIYDVLQNLYSEIIQLTGVDDIFHIGGDDVCLSCWSKHLNATDPKAVWLKFVRSALERLVYVNGKLPNVTLFWSSHLTDHFNDHAKDFNQLVGLQIRTATWAQKQPRGIRLIASHEDAWDLNSGFGDWLENKGKIPFNSWQRFYEHRPWVRTGVGNIIGGEATLWSWTVGAGTLDARVWPRAAALAERLWTDHPEGVTRKVYARLDVHRTRLANRGVHCAPIWSYWCTQNPLTCS